MNRKLVKMIGTISMILLTTGCAFSQAQTEMPKNLLRNPGFEDGVTGGSRKTFWSNSYLQEITNETATTRSGKKAIKMDTRVQNKSVFIVQQVQNIVGGAEYEFSVWARTLPGAQEKTRAAMKIELYSTHGGNVAYWSEGFDVPADGLWHQLKMRHRFLTSVNMCKLLLRAFTPYSIIYDDASLAMTSEPPELRVITPDKFILNIGATTPVTYKLALLHPWRNATLPQITAHVAPQDTAETGKSYNLPAKVTQIDDLHFDAKIQVPALEATDYVVNLELISDGKTYQTPYPAYLFTVPEKRRPAFLTETGTILKDGNPFFPIGIYHPISYDIPDEKGNMKSGYQILAENGFNAIQGGGPAGSGKYNAAKFQKSIDMAKKYGLASDVALYSGRQVKAILEENLQGIKDHADDPTVLNWKIFDEPLWKDVDGGTAAEIPGAYRAIKAVDPDHPIELTLNGKYDFWVNFCDIIQPDIYPLPRFEVSLVSERLKELQKAALPWQNISVVLQCGWSKNLSDQPTAPQARSMVYQALIHGAKGIWWYSMHEGKGWDLTQSPLWPHFKDINAEVKVLSEPMMLGENVAVKSTNSKIEVGAKKYQNKLYLLFTNPNKTEEKTELSIDSIKGLKEGALLKAKGKVNVADQKITLTLNPLQTDTLVFDLN